MPRNRMGLVVMTLLLVGVALLPGCTKKKPVVVPSAGTSSTSITPSESVVPTRVTQPVDTSSGPITTPAAGSDLRTRLMDAARAKLGTGAQFVIHQLFVQGDFAIGDIETTTGGKRQFVAWTGPEWKAVWVAPSGSAAATAAGAKVALPAFSAELLDKIEWKVVKPQTDEGMRSSLSAAAQKWAKKLMDGAGEPYKVTLLKVAKDNNGVWWGRAVVQPSGDASNSYESIEFWAKYQGGEWAGKAQDPEPPAPVSYFRASVLKALGF